MTEQPAIPQDSEVNYPINAMYPTVQCEGSMTGIPMILMRFQGCNVGCPFCDTHETWHYDDYYKTSKSSVIDKRHKSPTWAWFTVRDLLSACMDLGGVSMSWVMITGGEPAAFVLDYLIEELHRAGFKVCVETSGTAPAHVNHLIDWLVVSPKFGMQVPIIPEVLEAADELKFVIGKQADIDRAREVLTNLPLDMAKIVTLQPMSKSPKATELCYNACLKYGYRLSIQIHQYIEVP